jgi:microcystin-dependent protein
MFGGNFAPQGWALCEGQLIPIAENDTLFTLIGTTYGGDGQTTFALPDLRGRIPIHMGQGPGLSNYVIGESGGVEAVALLGAQMPAHGHALAASLNGAELTAGPNGSVTADTGATPLYSASMVAQDMHASAIAAAGGGQPHDNMAPFLCVNFIISLFGIFPSQN